MSDSNEIKHKRKERMLSVGEANVGLMCASWTAGRPVGGKSACLVG